MKHLHVLLPAIAIISTVVLTPSASAQTYYKCKASSGATVYTATPTPSQQCSIVEISGQYAATSAAKPSAPMSSANTAKNAPATTTVTTKMETVAVKASAAECAEARKAQTMLSSGQKVFETDQNGQRRYMDENTRTERMNQFKTMLDTRCNP